jgi:hypothetical protein
MGNPIGATSYRLAIVLCSSLVGLFGVSGTGQGSEPSAHTFPVCFDFSCRSEVTVSLDNNEWRGVRNLFFPPAINAKEERKRIQQAVGLMEIMAGKYTPTYRDLARNDEAVTSINSNTSGQLDCIDEAINTTTYLQLFEGDGLLRFHRVSERAYRRALFNQHWAAQLIEHGSGESYIIDSWFRDNGEPPYVVRGKQWHDLSVFRRRARNQLDRSVAVTVQAER